MAWGCLLLFLLLARGLVFAIAIPNTIECNNNTSQNTVYIIRGQFVGVNKPSRLMRINISLRRGFSTSVLFIFLVDVTATCKT